MLGVQKQKVLTYVNEINFSNTEINKFYVEYFKINISDKHYDFWSL